MTRSELHKIVRLYDDIAEEYAQAFNEDHVRKPKDREMLQRFAHALGDPGPVWDLGCGPGQTAQFLKNIGIEVAGLDLSAGILAQARAAHPGIRFNQGNLLDLAFEDNSIAGAVAFYAIVHFTTEQVGVGFREVYRVLRPGGLFLCTFHIGDDTIHLDEFFGKKIDIAFTFFPTAFIRRCPQASGFKKIEVIEREPYPEVEYQSRRGYAFARKAVV